MGLLTIRRKSERAGDSAQNDAQFEKLGAQQLGISDEAAAYIAELLVAKNDPTLFLRVAIKGGGCSGFSIHYEFTNVKRDADCEFSHQDARVIIDKKSLNILGGATLHVRDYLGSKSFVLVNNPNAKQCSCGQSFSL